MDLNWAKCLKREQNSSRSGQKHFIYERVAFISLRLEAFNLDSEMSVTGLGLTYAEGWVFCEVGMSWQDLNWIPWFGIKKKSALFLLHAVLGWGNHYNKTVAVLQHCWSIYMSQDLTLWGGNRCSFLLIYWIPVIWWVVSWISCHRMYSFDEDFSPQTLRTTLSQCLHWVSIAIFMFISCWAV